MVKRPESRHPRTRNGQSRILEAVIAAVIILVVFSAVTFLMHSSDVKVLQERGDLDRLGYNVLESVVESGTIEDLESKIDLGIGWVVPPHMKAILQRSLPPTTYFNLSIFNCTDSGPWVTLEPVDVANVTNTSGDSFRDSKEISSTTTMYTSKTGNVYNLVLVLARSGEGD